MYMNNRFFSFYHLCIFYAEESGTLAITQCSIVVFQGSCIVTDPITLPGYFLPFDDTLTMIK